MVDNEMTRKQADRLLKLFGPKGEHWCQGASARTINGTPCGPRDRNAVRWCLRGGLRYLFTEPMSERLQDALSLNVPAALMVTWNDAPRRRFSQVRALIEKCVE